MDEQGVINVELISPMKQKRWGWPAVANFILGGAGAGFYLLSFLTMILEAGTFALSEPASFGLLAPVLVSLGFLALTIEAVRPLRGRHLFRHVRHSWISRETLAGAIFVPAAVLDWLFPHPALGVLAVAAALGLMISQGFIVYRARAVTAWNVPIMPLLFMSSGLASGGGLVLLVAALDRLPLARGLVVIGLICVVLNLAVWLLYLRWSHATPFRLATDALCRPIAVILTAVLGHVVPLLLLLLLLIRPGVDARVELPHVVTALSGLAMIVGGMSQKVGIILAAGYTREIALRH